MNYETMRNFVEKRSSLDIHEITEIKLKDYDDINGVSGEHYIVSCKVMFEEYFGAEDTDIEIIENECLVRVDEFDRFSKSISSIKWLK